MEGKSRRSSFALMGEKHQIDWWKIGKAGNFYGQVFWWKTWPVFGGERFTVNNYRKCNFTVPAWRKCVECYWRIGFWYL